MNKQSSGFQEFLSLCLTSENEQKLANVFDLFLTDEERSALGLRFLIVRELLSEKRTQREIAKRLGVSIAKITRGSNELKRMDKKFLHYLKNKML